MRTHKIIYFISEIHDRFIHILSLYFFLMNLRQISFLKKNKTFFTLGGHDRDGGTTNGSGDSKQSASTRDRGDSIIGVY